MMVMAQVTTFVNITLHVADLYKFLITNYRNLPSMWQLRSEEQPLTLMCGIHT